MLPTGITMATSSYTNGYPQPRISITTPPGIIHGNVTTPRQFLPGPYRRQDMYQQGDPIHHSPPATSEQERR
jgi:hypothetical protein